MRGIRDQALTGEAVGEEAFAEGNRIGQRHAVYASRAPVFLRRLEDERRPLVREAIRVQVEPAPLGLAKVERKRVQRGAAAKPDEPIQPRLNIRPEDWLEASPRDRVG